MWLWRRIFSVIAVSVVFACGQGNPLIGEVEDLMRKGEYEAAVGRIREGYIERKDRARLATLEIRLLVEMGRNDEALMRARPLYRRASTDPRLCLEIIRALRGMGEYAGSLEVLQRVLEAQPGAETAEKIAYGELILMDKRDPKEVLQRYFQPAKEADAANRLPYLAIGRLALANHDRELAAENFREGLKRFPDDAELLLGMAQAGAELPGNLKDPEAGVNDYADLALKANPKFIEALLFRGRQLSDGKKFDEAETFLNRVFGVNPHHAEAWAALAGISHVKDRKEEAETRLERARETWFENPRVPEIIGACLARHYRFAEGIRFLEEARGKDQNSTTIAFELGSNLLRFGRIDEGWRFIEEVHGSDPYHVAAFNLITLRDRLKDFPVLERDGVLVRMSPEDAAVFGGRALELAVKAKTTLCEKYGVTLSQPVMVEMLPKQEDFAIRTFGLPGGESFLGVCFGPLITMTSPRGRLGRNNWEAILWHEMAHTITLEASLHRIPRWLTEGISVYEERQENSGWGQWMTADFRGRFVSGEFPPIAKLDEAFAGEDIMLGYFQGSLVVEHLFERFGVEKMRAVLKEISSGTTLAEAFAKHMTPLEEIGESFKAYVTARAKAYGGTLDWAALTDGEYRAYRADPAGWVSANPDRYAAVMLWVSKSSEEGKWEEAEKHLERLIAAEPANHEEANPYQMLAAACRGLGDEAGETAALKKLLELDANSAEAASRLVELGAKAPAEERLKRADDLLAINPFSESAYRAIAAASPDENGKKALGSLIALEPLDLGRMHYELALLLKKDDPGAARRHVLKALEDNPRFQSALEFLVSLPSRP